MLELHGEESRVGIPLICMRQLVAKAVTVTVVDTNLRENYPNTDNFPFPHTLRRGLPRDEGEGGCPRSSGTRG